jgi:hypothetical protein
LESFADSNFTFLNSTAVPNNKRFIIDTAVLLAGCYVISSMEGDMVEKMRAIVPRLTAKLYKVR